MLFLVSFAFISALITSSLAENYNYAEALEKSLLFYEAQRTGHLPSNNRILWRGDSFITDRGDDGEDLRGGYFDAGDHVKFQMPGAAAMTYLAWGMYDSKDGYLKSGQWENALNCLKWGMDYFIKSHPLPNVLYVQVGNAIEDHHFWGRPEDWNGSSPRPTLKADTLHPASDVACEQSAAMAAASIMFVENGDTDYANTLLTHAVQLYNFGTSYRGSISSTFPETQGFYNSTGYGDEFAWSAIWLYRATGEAQYRDDYIKWWSEYNLNYRPENTKWDLKVAHVQVLLAKIEGSAQYVNAARTFCDWAVNDAPKTPKGLIFIALWGSLRHAANVAYVCLQAANIGINTDTYRSFAKSQIDYMLGDTGRSYVVGFGYNPPVRPHHRAASCPDRPAICDGSALSSPNPNPQILYGALVGGPDENDQYVDDREDYVQNEVALDYNALYQSSIAELCSLHCSSGNSGASVVLFIYFVCLSFIVVSLLFSN